MHRPQEKKVWGPRRCGYRDAAWAVRGQGRSSHPPRFHPAERNASSTDAKHQYRGKQNMWYT